MRLEYWAILASLVGLCFALYLAWQVKRRSVENERAREISSYIHDGAMAFLYKQYKILAVFVMVLALVIGVAPALGWKISFSAVVGAILPILAGNIGMRIATIANVRTAEACKKSLSHGLDVAFGAGSVMGLSVVSLGLLGVSVLYLIFQDPDIIYGFGFGGAAVALFARVGGGIYTKAADVGADLVGKVEAGIPEDDPRNPAVIADNVGDNVGDVAGMGADLFESYVDSMVAAMAIGVLSAAKYGTKAVFLPLLLGAVGIIATILGNLIIKLRKGKTIYSTLNGGIWGSAAIIAVASYFITKYAIGENFLGVFGAILTGLIAGILIGLSTEYYTSEKNKPAQDVARAAETGPGTNIISGIALGFMSTIIPVVTLVLALFLSYSFAGLYGVAILAVGMLSTLGITLATDAYGPVADNAAGIAEMAGLGQDVRENAEQLDAVGNTTAAIGKGFAIGSAALTALALLIGFKQAAELAVVDLMDVRVLMGIFLGSLLTCIFSALTMKAVGQAAYHMVNEVRRQFREIPGLMEGKAKPDYKKCVEISTGAALSKMIVPGILGVSTPVLVGIVLGREALAGLLAGTTATGFVLAVFMANAGGAWDNAKKYIEKGNLGGKGSATHKAAVVGDTVGDPFKDTSGPSLNILIKLMAIISIVIAPLLLTLGR